MAGEDGLGSGDSESAAQRHHAFTDLDFARAGVARAQDDQFRPLQIQQGRFQTGEKPASISDSGLGIADFEAWFAPANAMPQRTSGFSQSSNRETRETRERETGVRGEIESVLGLPAETPKGISCIPRVSRLIS